MDFGVEAYDDVHAREREYRVPAEQSFYYPLFRRVAKEIRCGGLTSVLEVGCGSGVLAQLLMKQDGLSYQGFDFSFGGLDLGASVACQISITLGMFGFFEAAKRLELDTETSLMSPD